MMTKQSIHTIQEDFDLLLINNAAVHTSMTYAQMGILSETDALKLAIVTLSQQVEKLLDEQMKLLLHQPIIITKVPPGNPTSDH